jgi:hypothetical protein
MKFINRIAAWFKNKPDRFQEAGPVFKPIFRKVTSGAKTSKPINNG